MSETDVITPILWTVIRHEREIDFTIVADVYEYHVEFSWFDIAGWEERTDGEPGEWPRWAVGVGDSTDRLDKAERYLHGEVKWDGCSNWHFDEQERVMLHGCTRDDITRFGAAMGLCWDMAAELCPKWSGA